MLLVLHAYSIIFSVTKKDKILIVSFFLQIKSLVGSRKKKKKDFNEYNKVAVIISALASCMFVV